ncbi:helix-turn-helix domain-containing protein [Actinoallomurus sp. NPDC052274]|uniref:helix-turn-helix domain-containing protein n=1 Tax=Actinoallomurus sp. NPDC052274 TaxID=3155420 RepID=UPI003426BA99
MRFRLAPTPAQERALLDHCAHARYVWNLAVERHQYWRPGRASAPGCMKRSRQLTEARKAFAWPAAGSQTVQQQALRDFAGQEHQRHRRRTDGDSAGSPAIWQGCEPRTSTCSLLRVKRVGIPRL